MKCLDFDWQINEFMVYCRSTQPQIRYLGKRSDETASYV